jgi:hypothetical protein
MPCGMYPLGRRIKKHGVQVIICFLNSILMLPGIWKPPKAAESRASIMVAPSATVASNCCGVKLLSMGQASDVAAPLRLVLKIPQPGKILSRAEEKHVSQARGKMEVICQAHSARQIGNNRATWIVGNKKLRIPAVVSSSASRFPKKTAGSIYQRPLIDHQKSDQCNGIPCMRRNNATCSLNIRLYFPCFSNPST